MLELAAAICAGAAVATAVLSIGLPQPIVDTDGAVLVRRGFSRLWARERALALSSGWPWLDATALLVAQCAAGALGVAGALVFTGLPALGVPAAIGAAALVRMNVGSRGRALRIERQDAVLESVRMLRLLLETGAGTVQQAIGVLAERGPLPLRREFRIVAATSVGRRQAWARARDRVAEPLFDMLAAAVLIQGPGGGELAPLFAELEATVTIAQEVEREAEALQVQARSAAAIIVCLPIAFLLILSTFRSPYLDAFHSLTGQLFLLAMLTVMGASYAWMRRLLRLEGLQRVRLIDA